MLLNENDDYNFYKFKLEIRNFLIEMLDYLRTQQADMNSFLIVQSKSGQKDVNVDENSDEEKTSKKLKLDDEVEKSKVTASTSASSPTSLTSESASDSNSNQHVAATNNKNTIRMQVLRQVEYKKKHLDHIVQVLVQTINFLSTSLSESPFASTSTNSDSSSQSSSTESDTSENASKQTSLSSSPSHSHQPGVQKTT